MNPQAEELNEAIRKHAAPVYGLLSEKGKAIFFPKKGILSQTAEAKGKKINATIGMAVEDDGSPMRLKSIEKEISLNPKEVFTYAPSYGIKPLREKWQSLIKEKNPSLSGEISLPNVTNALTHGLSMIGYLFVNPGDEIILSDIYWGNYNLIFLNGYQAKFKKFNLFKAGGFDLDAFKESLVGKGKKIVLLNFPNNPTGYTPTVEEAKEIVSILTEAAKEKEILVVLDDAYFGLVYEEGVEKESLFAYLAHIHENILAVKIDGATKEDYVWGFRTGFITYAIKDGNKELYEALESKTAGAVRGNISNAAHISQSLLLHAYESSSYDQEKKEKCDVLKSRYEKVRKVLADEKFSKYFEPLPYNSGYFMCIKLKNLDSEKMRQVLLEKYDTGVIAIPEILRIAFSAVAEDQIEELFENIYQAAINI